MAASTCALCPDSVMDTQRQTKRVCQAGPREAGRDTELSHGEEADRVRGRPGWCNLRRDTAREGLRGPAVALTATLGVTFPWGSNKVTSAGVD